MIYYLIVLYVVVTLTMTTFFHMTERVSIRKAFLAALIGTTTMFGLCLAMIFVDFDTNHLNVY